MVGMQFGIFQRHNGRSVQQSSPVDAEGVHDETGHTDSFAYHEIGGGEGCMMGGEEEKEGAIEGLHCGGGSSYCCYLSACCCFMLLVGVINE